MLVFLKKYPVTISSTPPNAKVDTGPIRSTNATINGSSAYNGSVVRTINAIADGSDLAEANISSIEFAGL